MTGMVEELFSHRLGGSPVLQRHYASPAPGLNKSEEVIAVSTAVDEKACKHLQTILTEIVVVCTTVVYAWDGCTETNYP